MFYARDFSVKDPIIFIIVGIIIAVVLAQSVFFLVRTMKRAKEIGMDKSIIKKTISRSIIFTIAPAAAVLVGVVSLSKSLGLAIPWLRLSVIGSISYETVAAGNAVNALGGKLSETISDPNAFVTVVWIMTTGIMLGLVIVPLFTKKIEAGVMKIGSKDKRWGEIFNEAMFLGMISAFLGYVFSDVLGVVHHDFSGLVPVFVMITSALIMAVLGILSKKLKQRWITDYALPISLIVGMASAILYTNLLV